MIIQVEASFYPLARADINESVNRFCSIISNKGLSVVTSAMSSVISGESAVVMHILTEAINVVGEDSKFVLVCKISNACPL